MPVIWNFGLRRTLFRKCCGKRLLRLRRAGIPEITWEECEVCGKVYNKYNHTFPTPEQDGIRRAKKGRDE